MNYCVVKNTTKVIDGSENPIEIMLRNAQNAGFSGDEIEILTEEEFQARAASMPIPPEQEIMQLKKQLAETDYKVIKCYEYYLVGLELPYDIEALHAERQPIRDRINELELQIAQGTNVTEEV